MNEIYVKVQGASETAITRVFAGFAVTPISEQQYQTNPPELVNIGKQVCHGCTAQANVTYDGSLDAMQAANALLGPRLTPGSTTGAFPVVRYYRLALPDVQESPQTHRLRQMRQRLGQPVQGDIFAERL